MEHVIGNASDSAAPWVIICERLEVNSNNDFTCNLVLGHVQDMFVSGLSIHGKHELLLLACTL